MTDNHNKTVSPQLNEKLSKIKRRFPLFVENMGEDLMMMLSLKRQEIQAKLDSFFNK